MMTHANKNWTHKIQDYLYKLNVDRSMVLLKLAIKHLLDCIHIAYDLEIILLR
jgi:hypothetical protein